MLETVADARTQGRPPLLLIHGVTATGRIWDGLVPDLEPHYALIIPTLIGHRGGPPLPKAMGRPLDALADGLERVLDEAGHDTVHVVGNSLGGWLAFELAARGRARSVLALSPGFGWEGDAVPRHVLRFFRRANWLAPRTARLARTLAARPRLRRLALTDIMVRPEKLPAASACEIIESAGDCQMLGALLEADRAGQRRTELAPFDVPVRIAWSEADRVLPQATCSGHFRTLIPHAEWVTLSGCGHVPMLDEPALVARQVHEVVRQAALGAALDPASEPARVRDRHLAV